MRQRLIQRLWIPEAPHVLRGGRTAEVVMGAARVGMAGRFVVELLHARTGLVARRLAFRNLITDVGLNRPGAGAINSVIQYYGVGTGTTAPAPGQTTLVAELARTNSAGGFGDVSSQWEPGNEFIFFRRTRVFTEAQANGNLTEVGVFQSAAGGAMFARQLLLDELGEPTTITKTSEYQLRITYEFRLYPPNGWGDYTFEADVAGTLREMQARPSATTHSGAWTASEFGSTPALSHSAQANQAGWCAMSADATLDSAANWTNRGSATTGKSNEPYVPDSHYREQVQEWGGAALNDQDIRWWGWQGVSASFQALMPVAIAKDNTQKFVVIARAHWGRYEP